MKILYFAFLRQRTGLGEETVEAPADVHDVASLVEWLKTRGPGYAEALRDTSAVRVAVNQEFADLHTPVAANDEIAFFPPVTGG
jgi:molybdopterin synthase sulfur carrier subunit